MEDRQAILVFEQLTEILRVNGLFWVVQEIDEQVEQGKIEKIKIPIYKESDDEKNPHSQPRLFDSKDAGNQLELATKQERVVIADYAPREKLLLLVDAIENVITQTAAIADQIHKFYDDELDIDRENHEPEIVFYSGLPGTESFIFTKDSVDRSTTLAGRLIPLLKKLREHI